MSLYAVVFTDAAFLFTAERHSLANRGQAHCADPFSSWQTFGLLAPFGCVEECCCDHSCFMSMEIDGVAFVVVVYLEDGSIGSESLLDFVRNFQSAYIVLYSHP